MDTQPNNPSSNNSSRPFSVGAALREAREHLGLTLADVANRLKFAPRQIEALEEDNFARLPEIAFVRGFVRSYAKLLQLDPGPLLAALPQPPAQTELLAASPGKEVRFPDADATRRQNYFWLAAGLAVAAALGLFVWLNGSSPQVKVEKLELPAVSAPPASAVVEAPPSSKAPATPSQVSTSPAKAPLVGPPLPPSVKASQEGAGSASKAAAIHMTFDQDAWVEVTDKYGTFLMSQLNLGGTERRISGSPPFTLTIGNASAVHLLYQGKAVDLAPFNRAEVAHLTLE